MSDSPIDELIEQIEYLIHRGELEEALQQCGVALELNETHLDLLCLRGVV